MLLRKAKVVKTYLNSQWSIVQSPKSIVNSTWSNTIKATKQQPRALVIAKSPLYDRQQAGREGI